MNDVHNEESEGICIGGQDLFEVVFAQPQLGLQLFEHAQFEGSLNFRVLNLQVDVPADVQPGSSQPQGFSLILDPVVDALVVCTIHQMH